MGSDGSLDSTTASTVPGDEQLLLAFQCGDRSALVAIVERHEDRLARIAYRIVGCRNEAEDVRHAVFVRFLRIIDRSQQIENVGAWLTRCTVNEGITRVRQRERESRTRAELVRLARTAREPTPLERLQDDESREQLSVALATLSPDERALVSLRFDAGLTFREIAEVLGRSASTVKSQLSQAITRLRKSLSMRH